MPTTRAILSFQEQCSSVERNSIVLVRDLHKYYILGDGRVHVLRGISLDIKAGDFVAIMGASGSGKSTFMNILGSLDLPTSGIYEFEGTNVARLNKPEIARFRNKKIGFVFQGFNLLSRTSSLENVELPMFYAGVEAAQRKQRAVEALKLVGLAKRGHHFSSQLSGGQQQRVAIARSLVNHPSLILADEPTGNLDSRTSVEIMEILQNLNDDGMTIVLVTHEPEIAQYATRQITFRDGRIKSDRQVQNRMRASEVLKTLPAVED
jgi:putative ABC transport system ATP-binding protein